MRTRRLIFTFATLVGVLSVSSLALAADDDDGASPPPKKKERRVTEEGDGDGGGEKPKPKPKPEAKSESKSEDSTGDDHAGVVGRLGIGYFGEFDIPIGAGAGGAAFTGKTQVIGVRYWLSEGLGLDLGLGLLITSSSVSSGGTSVNNATPTGFALKAGLPLKMFGSKHYLFFIDPQLNLGYGSVTQSGGAGAPDTGNNGFRIRVGATAGAEIQFGFIGIPQLALDASVGLYLDYATSTTSPPSPAASTTLSNLVLATDSFTNPWNIFTTNVAARYYF